MIRFSHIGGRMALVFGALLIPIATPAHADAARAFANGGGPVQRGRRYTSLTEKKRKIASAATVPKINGTKSIIAIS